MSNIKKFVAGFATVALALSGFAFAPVADAATAGGVYKTTDGTVWFVTDSMQRRPFTSAGAFMSYGFLSFSQVMEADSSVTALPTGSFIAPQDGRIFCATETKGTDVAGECAEITASKKASFTSASVFAGQGFSFSRAYYGDSSFLEKTSNIDNASAQHRAGTLINNNGTVQLVVSGGLWGVPSMDVFNSWGWSFADVVPANSADVLLSQTGVIPARMAGQLVPTASSNPDPGSGDCNIDGVAGDATITLLSTYTAEEVGQGEDEVPVMAFEVEADDDSDIEVTSVKIELEQTVGTNSQNITDYIDEVVIMMGDEVVGSADADDFTESSDRYSKSISLDDCTIVDAGETAIFTVAITALNNLDSGDINDDAWDVELDSLRFVDGDGVTTTETPAADAIDQAFDFAPFATAADVNLQISLGDDAINDAHVINVDDSDTTDDVELLSFMAEAEGDSDITIKDLPVTVTTTETTGTDPADLITTYYLYADGDLVGTESPVDAGDNSTEVVLFDDIDVEISAGDEIEFIVKAKLKSTGSTLDDGDTIQVTFGEVETDLASFDAEDEQGDELADGDKNGTATGDAHAVYDVGFNLELVGTPTFTVQTNDTTADVGTATIKYEVTAFDGDIYIDNTCIEDNDGGEVATATSYSVTNPGSNATSCVVTSTGDTDGGTAFLIEEGTSETITLTVSVIPTADSFAQVKLEAIGWDIAAGGDNNVFDFNLPGDFETDPVFLNFTA